MHDIIAQIIEKAKKKSDNVKSILVEVGELSKYSPEEIQKKINEAVDWQVIVATKRSKVKCSCGYEGNPKIIEKRHNLTLFVCPNCSSLPKVYEGKDIVLKEVKAEEK